MTRRRLLAGAGSARIEWSADLFPIEGFVGVLDPLEARVVMFDDGGGARVAVAVIDQTSVSDRFAVLLRSVVAEECVLAPEDVVVVASHTFSAPHVMDDDPSGDGGRNAELRDALMGALRAAARSAAAGLDPATVAVSAGVCDVNVNRDVLTDAGYWLGANESGTSDKSVTSIIVRRDDGQVVAVLVSYGVQPSVLADSYVPGGGRLVSADLAGVAMRHVESQYPGAVSMFLVGAGGDQAPRFAAVFATVDRGGAWRARDLGASAQVLVDVQGQRLGDAVVSLVEAAPAGEASPVIRVVRDEVVVVSREPLPRERIGPQLECDWVPAAPVAVPLILVSIGDVALVCVAPELTAVTGMDIVARSAVPSTIVVTMANGAAKYMADQSSFDRVTYAAQSSRFAPGSAESVANRLVDLLGVGRRASGATVGDC